MPRHKSDYLDNPVTQIKFHKRMMRFWVRFAVVMNLVYFYSVYLAVTHHAIAALVLAGFINYVTNQISFYANWDTDYGAVSSAQASLKAENAHQTSEENQDLIEDTQDTLEDIAIRHAGHGV